MHKNFLLIVPLVLTACATQEATVAPAPKPTSVTNCVTECEIFHGGYVRGCRSNGYSGQDRSEWTTCMDEANEQLGRCYAECE